MMDFLTSTFSNYELAAGCWLLPCAFLLLLRKEIRQSCDDPSSIKIFPVFSETHIWFRIVLTDCYIGFFQKDDFPKNRLSSFLTYCSSASLCNLTFEVSFSCNPPILLMLNRSFVIERNK